MNPWGRLVNQSRREFRQLQNAKLQHFISRYLYPFSPHYHRLFDQAKIDPRRIRTVEDLRCIPFTSKKDFIDPANPNVVRDFIFQPDAGKIRAAWPLFKLLELKSLGLLRGKEYVKEKLGQEFRPVFITFTTGTTNRPVSFTYSSYDIVNLYTSGGRMLDLFQITTEERLVNLFPFAPHLAIWQVVFGGLAAGHLVLSTGGGKVMGTDGNIAAIEKMSPSVILGVPSFVYHVLLVAQQQGRKLSSINKVVLGAAAVTPAFKLKIVELLDAMGAQNVRVFGTYGFTEARAAWAECPTANDCSSGYHLYPDKEIFEIIDPQTGETLDDGADGEIVYTSIDSRASSVVRYRTGDFVKGGITWEPCPHCKRSVPRLSSDITRLSDQKELHFSKIKGSLVNFNNFDATFSEMPQIEEWQIELCKKNNDPFEIDELVVYICAKAGYNTVKLADDIKSRLLVTTEVSPNRIEFIPMDVMVKRLELETSNKEKRILDNRPKNQ